LTKLGYLFLPGKGYVGVRDPVRGLRYPVCGLSMSVAGRRSPLAGYRMPVCGLRFEFAARRLPVCGLSLPDTGRRMPVTFSLRNLVIFLSSDLETRKKRVNLLLINLT